MCEGKTCSLFKSFTNWGCASCSYIDVRTERIFQGFASDRRQHYFLVQPGANSFQCFWKGFPNMCYTVRESLFGCR
jgi:hypothetical protein